MSESLRTNEQPWGIRSGRSEGMSNREQITQVAHQKWANERIAHFFGKIRAIRSKIRWANSQPCTRFFCPCLFHESKTSGPLIKNSFCEDIREISDSAQANTERSRKLKCLQIQNWLALRRVGLCAGNHCAETNFFFVYFGKSPFSGNLGSLWWYFEKN